MKFTLPTDSTARKSVPMAGGCRDYFPAALAGVARWSKQGNDKHNPGEPLHHARGKSMDHEECIERHGTDLADVLAALDRLGTQAGMIDTTDGKVKAELIQAALDEYDARSWRSLAASQEFREKHGLAPLAPGARLPSRPALVVTGNPPHVQAAFAEWEKSAAVARSQGVTLPLKRDDTTEAVIEQRRVRAMRGRLEGEKTPTEEQFAPLERGDYDARSFLPDN